MKSTDNCGVCGQPLVYSTEDIIQKCAFCGETHRAPIYCTQGHYVCDTCHKLGALEVLREVLNVTKSIDPLEILESVIRHPSVPMHGPEHHAMVPAIIVSAVRNTSYPIPEGAVEKALDRGARVPGGWCGFYGACGAAIGVGIAISVLTGATPLTGDTRALANEATAFALNRMLDGGPRCCKRASRMALEAAIEFLNTRMGIKLESTRDIQCRYVERNRECIHDECAYYVKTSHR